MLPSVKSSLLYRCMSATHISRRPLCCLYSAVQFVLADARSNAVFLCLDANRYRDFRGHPPEVCQGGQQGRGSIFERRRISGEPSSRCQYHGHRDPPSARRDNAKSHSRKDVDVIALCDRNRATAVIDRSKRRTCSDQSTPFGPTKLNRRRLLPILRSDSRAGR